MCCCVGAANETDRLVIRAACDDTVPATPAAALVAAFKIAPLSSMRVGMPTPMLDQVGQTRYWLPEKAAVVTRSCPPPDQPPRFLC